MKLVICEKPSVGAAVAAALGVREKKDGYIEGKVYRTKNDVVKDMPFIYVSGKDV